jgi:hypothetical protein
MVDLVYGDKALKKTANYAILKKVKSRNTTEDQRLFNPKKMVRTASLIASVATAIEDDRRLGVKYLVAAHGVSIYTIHSILHKDLGLEKKSAKWVPKLLSDEQKKSVSGPAQPSSPPSSAGQCRCWITCHYG